MLLQVYNFVDYGKNGGLETIKLCHRDSIEENRFVVIGPRIFSTTATCTRAGRILGIRGQWIRVWVFMAPRLGSEVRIRLVVIGHVNRRVCRKILVLRSVVTTCR
jgi:hypothetical protein